MADLDELERLMAPRDRSIDDIADDTRAIVDAAPALIAAARERDRLREVIRIGGALLRLERAALGVPGGIDPEAERLRALCREAADALGAIDSALECECVCDCASDEQEHEPECQRCAACTVDDVLPARLRARLRAAGGGS